MVRETRLSPENFLYPLFVRTGQGIRREIGSMPGQFQLSVDVLPREIAELAEACEQLGLPVLAGLRAGGVEQRAGLRDARDDLVGADAAHVEVGDQRERAAAR